jgi:hypothetical protein
VGKASPILVTGAAGAVGSIGRLTEMLLATAIPAAVTIPPVTGDYVGRFAPGTPPQTGFHVSARRRQSQSDIEKARMALAGGY